LLDAKAVYPGRSARSHLRTMAATHNITASRVSEVIEMTGLAGVATKRVGGFSLGMGQRLGIAAALLGDPGTLILDEPVNGLDPDGVQWVRQLVRGLAAEGRTVFLSSHLMSEMSQTADQLLVIGRGRIIAAGSVQQVIDSVAGGAVRVRSPRAGELAAALAADGATVTSPEAGMLESRRRSGVKYRPAVNDVGTSAPSTPSLASCSSPAAMKTAYRFACPNSTSANDRGPQRRAGPARMEGSSPPREPTPQGQPNHRPPLHNRGSGRRRPSGTWRSTGSISAANTTFATHTAAGSVSMPSIKVGSPARTKRGSVL
jgi:hypothetical protein